MLIYFLMPKMYTKTWSESFKIIIHLCQLVNSKTYWIMDKLLEVADLQTFYLTHSQLKCGSLPLKVPPMLKSLLTKSHTNSPRQTLSDHLELEKSLTKSSNFMLFSISKQLCTGQVMPTTGIMTGVISAVVTSQLLD